MPTAQAAIDDFLAQKRIAVAGVSREAGGKHGGNVIYQRLRERGYQVFAVNPNADTVEGDPCYRSLAAIPGGVDAVVIATTPSVAPSVVAGVPGAGHHARLDASLVRRRKRLQGGPRAVPPERHRVDRGRLPAHVRADLRRRPPLHAPHARALRQAARRRPEARARRRVRRAARAMARSASRRRPTSWRPVPAGALAAGDARGASASAWAAARRSCPTGSRVASTATSRATRSRGTAAGSPPGSLLDLLERSWRRARPARRPDDLPASSAAAPTSAAGGRLACRDPAGRRSSGATEDATRSPTWPRGVSGAGPTSEQRPSRARSTCCSSGACWPETASPSGVLRRATADLRRVRRRAGLPGSPQRSQPAVAVAALDAVPRVDGRDGGPGPGRRRVLVGLGRVRDARAATRRPSRVPAPLRRRVVGAGGGGRARGRALGQRGIPAAWRRALPEAPRARALVDRLIETDAPGWDGEPWRTSTSSPLRVDALDLSGLDGCCRRHRSASRSSRVGGTWATTRGALARPRHRRRTAAGAGRRHPAPARRGRRAGPVPRHGDRRGARRPGRGTGPLPDPRSAPAPRRHGVPGDGRLPAAEGPRGGFGRDRLSRRARPGRDDSGVPAARGRAPRGRVDRAGPAGASRRAHAPGPAGLRAGVAAGSIGRSPATRCRGGSACSAAGLRVLRARAPIAGRTVRPASTPICERSAGGLARSGVDDPDRSALPGMPPFTSTQASPRGTS